MAQMNADRNLLLGILALQMDFVSRDALISAMNAWVLDKSKSLGEILAAQQALTSKRLMLLESLVDEHLAQHGHDPERSLAAVSSAGLVREKLAEINDPEMHASLARALGPPRVDVSRTAEMITTDQPTKWGGSRFVVLRPHGRGDWARFS
jgi:eukaryotic-like serine/threonine-protein kinase